MPDAAVSCQAGQDRMPASVDRRTDRTGPSLTKSGFGKGVQVKMLYSLIGCLKSRYSDVDVGCFSCLFRK